MGSFVPNWPCMTWRSEWQKPAVRSSTRSSLSLILGTSTVTSSYGLLYCHHVRGVCMSAMGTEIEPRGGGRPSFETAIPVSLPLCIDVSTSELIQDVQTVSEVVCLHLVRTPAPSRVFTVQQLPGLTT